VIRTGSASSDAAPRPRVSAPRAGADAAARDGPRALEDIPRRNGGAREGGRNLDMESALDAGAPASHAELPSRCLTASCAASLVATTTGSLRLPSPSLPGKAALSPQSRRSQQQRVAAERDLPAE